MIKLSGKELSEEDRKLSVEEFINKQLRKEIEKLDKEGKFIATREIIGERLSSILQKNPAKIAGFIYIRLMR